MNKLLNLLDEFIVEKNASWNHQDWLSLLDRINSNGIKIPESELGEILENEKYRKFFKTFATREYSVENIVFYEEVKKFKKLNEEERKIRSLEMIEIFLNTESMLEINTTAELTKEILRNVEESKEDLFDKMLSDLTFGTISNSYDRFLFSDLYQEMMIKEKLKKKPQYYLFK